MYRDFDSLRLRNLFFSSVRAGNYTNGYDSVLLETSSVWRGEDPGDYYITFKVDEISTNSKTHILLVIIYSTAHLTASAALNEWSIVKWVVLYNQDVVYLFLVFVGRVKRAYHFRPKRC